MKRMAIAAAAMLLAVATIRAAQPAPPAETSEQRDKRMAWWREARFGMFIHWGLYAIPAGEWNGRKVGGIGEWIMNSAGIPVAEYEKLVQQFNPVKFNAREWVSIAADAGMKYIVITSKHHDGFCLWDSKVTEYDIMATPFKRDVLKELAEACAEKGVVLCFYHSIMDWHHPDAQAIGYPRYNNAPPNPNFPRYVETYLKPQLKELLTGYGRIGVLWFDGEWIKDWTEPMARDMVAYLRSMRPDLIINNRVGKGRKGMQGMSDPGFSGDFGTPEQEIPATGFPGVDWESCMTMNNTWGYRKDDNNWKSTQTIVRMLIDCASKGGNFLLNVGPTAEGLIPEPSVQRLREVGAWMKVNGEAIYGTSASCFKRLPFGRCTRKPGKLYLHVEQWPADGAIVVPISNKVNRAYLLADRNTPLAVAAAGDAGVRISVPASAPDPIATVVVVEIEGEPQVLATPPLRQGADGKITLRAADADITGSARLESKGGEPNIGFWTSAEDTVQWRVQVDRPGRFAVEVLYACESASAGSEYQIIAGSSTLSARVEATKSWNDFAVARPGHITIDNAGVITITVKPVKKPGQAVMNLRRVTLTPAAP